MLIRFRTTGTPDGQGAGPIFLAGGGGSGGILVKENEIAGLHNALRLDELLSADLADLSCHPGRESVRDGRSPGRDGRYARHGRLHVEFRAGKLSSSTTLPTTLTSAAPDRAVHHGLLMEVGLKGRRPAPDMDRRRVVIGRCRGRRS